MASIEKITTKDGDSYRITVSAGFDYKGNRIRHRMTWHPPDSIHTEKQVKKALERVVADFERQIEQGYQPDNNLTFAEYATKVVQQKLANGEVTPRTADRYQEFFERIFKEIGHIKIIDIRAHHLNAFYQALQKEGARTSPDTAVANSRLAELLKEKRISRASIARKTKLSASTVGVAVSGKPVSEKTARVIAAALGIDVAEFFELRTNTLPLSNKTVLEHHRLISSVLAQAEKEMLVPYNAAKKASPPKVRRKEPNYLQPAQIQKIFEALENESLKWRTLVHLMIVTGCRRGEIMGLKWEMVDFATNTIKIAVSLGYCRSTGVQLGTTKNKKARRLKLPDETMALLQEYRQEQLMLQAASGDLWIDSGYVFTSETGDHMHPDSVTNWLSDFAKRHNLGHLNPHAFRHAVASILFANGIDAVTVSKQLGHTSVQTTTSYYAHLIDDTLAKASDCIATNMLPRRKEAP